MKKSITLAVVLTGIMFIALPAAEPDGKSVPDKTKARPSKDVVRPTTKEEKLAIARKLAKQATELRDDSLECAVLQMEARKLAIEAGDATLAFELADAISKGFDAIGPPQDPWRLRLDTLISLNHEGKSSELVEQGIDLIRRAMNDDRYPIALQLADATAKLAHENKKAKPSVLDSFGLSKNRTSGIVHALDRLEPALKKLKLQPADPAANLAVGRFRCFELNDWAKGLPLLARGSDEALKQAAALDSSNPTKAAERKALGDTWWDLSVSAAAWRSPLERADGEAVDPLRARARYWYALATPGLNAAEKQELQERLTEQTPLTMTDEEIVAVARSEPFASRTLKYRTELAARFGGTRQTERAVAAALYWFAAHQARDGSWGLQQYLKQCKDKSCTGPGDLESLSAATAMGLLPYLAIGQTQSSDGPFQRVVGNGVNWLVGHQQPDGDLSAGAASQMYSHGLATIALCEDYGLSRDRAVGSAAQNAVNFIQTAQNEKTGGWRYHPGQDGDTSVLGWQFMALKSAKMAGLQVNPAVLDGAKKWLQSVSSSEMPGGARCRYSYQPAIRATPSMTAVGLLCNQYSGVGRDDPAMVGGVGYLMSNQPNPDNHNLYYWYYATQVMHNMADKDWETWNRKVRSILVNTQSREGCASGSWDPEKPQRDSRAGSGGRVTMTSFSALTLEVYYRYLPVCAPKEQDSTPAEKAKP